MSLVLNIIIWGLLAFFTYHLTRDILQDVLNIHNSVIDVMHMTPKHGTHLLGKYFKFWGMPFEILVIILSFLSIYNSTFGIYGFSSLFLFIVFVSLWAYTSF